MSEMIVRFHHDERGIATSWDEVGKLSRCKNCKHWNNIPTSDGYNSCVIDALIRHESLLFDVVLLTRRKTALLYADRRRMVGGDRV